MGFTPELVAGTWVGGEERYIHFNSMADGQGAEMALPIFGKFMRKVYNDKSLPYTESSQFTFPGYIDLCDGISTSNDDVVETTLEDVFD
jgi:penicillin-binding protein 1A